MNSVQCELIFVYNVLVQMIAEYCSVAPSESNGGVLYITSDLQRTAIISDSAGNVVSEP